MGVQSTMLAHSTSTSRTPDTSLRIQRNLLFRPFVSLLFELQGRFRLGAAASILAFGSSLPSSGGPRHLAQRLHLKAPQQEYQ